MKQGVFLRAMAADASEMVVDIIGVIGWEVGYQQMREIIRGIPEAIKRVTFDIYSPGGDVWEGNGVVQEIGELGKRVETVARVQVAASMATLIAAACKTRTIARNGRWLIHNAWTQTIGDAAAHEKAAQTLHDAEVEASKFYAERTGQTAEAMLKLMAEERWIMPEEAKALGFVQEISDPFKAEDYEAVRQEIVAAGKWPQALVEIPKPEEVKPDASKPVEPVAAPVAAVEPPTPEQPADAQTEYKRGLADGEAIGRQAAITELGDQAEALKARLAVIEKEARLNQSEKDRLAAQLVQVQKVADERAEKLRKEVKDATDKLARHVAGSLTFQPAVETWEDAMRACAGNYVKAAKEYPELLNQYRARKAQEGK
jgi:ATP-dependent protease ClpP protease subunit